jgi:hypothetical protein
MQTMQGGEMEAACHCGTVRFRVKLTDGFKTARRCTCSYCRMRGAVAVSADIGGISFQAGEEALTLYRFNTAWRSITFVRNAASTPTIAAGLGPRQRQPGIYDRPGKPPTKHGHYSQLSRQLSTKLPVERWSDHLLIKLRVQKDFSACRISSAVHFAPINAVSPKRNNSPAARGSDKYKE